MTQYHTIEDVRGDVRIDSRDLIELRDYMRDALAIEDDALDADERVEMRDAIDAIDALELEVGGEWEYGAGLIREDCFEDYARELADDIGTISDAWPSRCIDWEQAASELAMDYTLVSFLGHDYYVR